MRKTEQLIPCENSTIPKCFGTLLPITKIDTIYCQWGIPKTFVVEIYKCSECGRKIEDNA